MFLFDFSFMNDEQIAQSHSIYCLALVVLQCKANVLFLNGRQGNCSALVVQRWPDFQLRDGPSDIWIIRVVEGRWSIGNWNFDFQTGFTDFSSLHCCIDSYHMQTHGYLLFPGPALESRSGHNVCICQWSYQILLNCLCLVTNWTFTHG